ncbi:SRPBCC domain-containing protein [Actinophytocola xanthii]|uniref:ATPase n=1 Tax=Actinophytocola xanthii TaxID=1912961 RepID=A0A1Q8CT66_9PSEU|nr:SRPBCC domain-containing protein [Actinophytocola xanthii]OLF17514.1 ATPase [Actinophytocola xanthii]
MIDIDTQLSAIQREVATRGTDGAEEVAVLLRRRYEAQAADVWQAVAEPDQLRRWFTPVSGDLRVGGTFQLEGNAGGEILTCEAPHLLRVTFGAPTSILELRLSAADGSTLLELEHTVPLELAGSGAGALYVGPGWDGALLALGLYLDGEVAEDPAAAGNSPEGIEFARRSVHVWAEAITASGAASPEEVTAATEASLAQFAPATA